MRSHLILRGAAAALALASLGFAQTPEVLVPSGSLDGWYALVDHDNDGVYKTDGEAWDSILDGVDSSPQRGEWYNGVFYWADAKLDQILSAKDANNNGQIEIGERTVVFDLGANFGTSEPNHLAIDANGVLWWTNDGGTAEGVWRSQDLNGDGDAEDPGETMPAFTEPSTVLLGNSAATPMVSPTALDSIMYDPSWGNGRFLCEEENLDFTVALEDLNGDGDFLDPGEVYLFSALYNGGTLQPDTNPDVIAGLLPSSNEMHNHQVDTTGTTPVYYLQSLETTAANTDAGIIYRAVDGNNDGDVNDAGEVTIYWDGSLDSPGATAAYNFCYGMTFYNGRLYVMAELDGDPDHEQLLWLLDTNSDNDANDPGETIVLWELPVDRTLYNPAIAPAGTIGTPPAGLPATYRYYGVPTCASSGPCTQPNCPAYHNIQSGSTNFNDKPTLGNPSYVLRTWGAASSSPGIYAVGVGQVPSGIALDPGASCNVYQSADAFVLPFSTDGNGQWNLPFPLPNDPGLLGVPTYWQSVVIDGSSGAGLGFTVSDGLMMRIGRYSYTVE